MCIILKESCCGCSLWTGSLFIAIFGLVFYNKNKDYFPFYLQFLICVIKIGNIGEIITGVIVLINDHSTGTFTVIDKTNRFNHIK